MTIACSLVVCLHHKQVDPLAFRAINHACLVFDYRLVVDTVFHTNDPDIFAAGPLTKYSRRYHSEWCVYVYVCLCVCAYVHACIHANMPVSVCVFVCVHGSACLSVCLSALSISIFIMNCFMTIVRSHCNYNAGEVGQKVEL